MSDLLKLEHQLCFPIYVLSREITKAYRPLLEQFDITYPQYLVLMVLWEQDGQTVNQIGDKLHLDSGTLTPLLKRLESKDMIVRSRLKSDERSVAISITDKGLAIKDRACSIPKELVNNLSMDEEELALLKKIIHKLNQK